jgi:erythromycin esterase-like protein
MDKNRFETQKEVLYLDYTGKITRPQNFFTVEDLKWLMEQAEKVERYEMKYENTGAIFNRQHMRERIEFLEKELYQQKELTALWKEKYLEENKKLLKLLGE